MSILIGIASFYAVLGSYIVAPDLYSHGPYEFETQYNSLEECQIDSHGTGSICTTEAPYQLYVKSDTSKNHSTKPIEFVECDHWAGCYTQED